MAVMDQAKLLGEEIRRSEEYLAFARAKEEAFENETSAALLKEFGRLQMKLQMTAVAGGQPDADEMKRFQQMSALLYATPETSAYLLSQMRLQKLMADVFSYLSGEAGLPIDVPN